MSRSWDLHAVFQECLSTNRGRVLKKNQVHKAKQNKFLFSHPRMHHFLVAHREKLYYLYTLSWYLNLVFRNRCLVSKSCRTQILLYFYPVIVRSINYQLQKCKRCPHVPSQLWIEMAWWIMPSSSMILECYRACDSLDIFFSYFSNPFFNFFPTDRPCISRGWRPETNN